LQHRISGGRPPGVQQQPRVLAVGRRLTRRDLHPPLEGGRGGLVAMQVRKRPELHRAKHWLAGALRDHRVDQRENGIALPELIVDALDPENRGRRGLVERRAVGAQRLPPLPRLLELEPTHR
jgi:hypothetical protein